MNAVGRRRRAGGAPDPGGRPRAGPPRAGDADAGGAENGGAEDGDADAGGAEDGRRTRGTEGGVAVRDLRQWLAKVEAMGELETITGADWNLEIGTICETWGPDAQALLFDEIAGYPRGMRVLTNSLQSPARLTMTLGMEPIRAKLPAVRAIRERMRRLAHVPPEEVAGGPVLEVVREGAAVNLFDFPAPFWHELDGGRFIGTGTACVTRDPESGWVNLGCYRLQIHDGRTTGVAITYGHHGLMIMEKHWARGEPCPMAVSLGHDPLLLAVAGTETPYGVSEYGVAGGFMEEPVPVVRGPYTGLPIPAQAEIVLEGEVAAGERLPEGPHAEWAGYYASGRQPRPVFHVRAICHRRDPIILGATPGKPPSDNTYFLSPFKSAAVWDQMERAGVPGVAGVWEHECGGGRMLLTVALKQMYPGHSKQAGHVAAFCHQGAYAARMVITVDEDVDPTDLEEVMWAVCTRCDFHDGIDVSHRNWTSPLDPTRYPQDDEFGAFNSRVVLDACRPWERRASFPPVARNGAAVRQRVMEKFGAHFARRRTVTDRSGP
jgi:UbiD family decarboxylase